MNKELYRFISADGNTASITQEGLDAMYLATRQSTLEKNQKPQAIIDIDDTLRCSLNRRHLINPTADIDIQDTYRAFNLAAGNDEPILPIVELVKSLSRTHGVILLSACTACDTTVTAVYQQMTRWGVPFEAMFLRGADNHLTDSNMKEHFVVDSGISRYPAQVLCVDNNEGNCKMFNRLGFPTLHYLAK